MTPMSCDSVEQTTTTSLEACWEASSMPEATEFDRLLQEATSAALITGASSTQSCSRSNNANNQHLAAQTVTFATDDDPPPAVSGGGQATNEMIKEAKTKTSKKGTSLRRRVRSLFGLWRSHNNKDSNKKSPLTSSAEPASTKLQQQYNRNATAEVQDCNHRGIDTLGRVRLAGKASKKRHKYYKGPPKFPHKKQRSKSDYNGSSQINSHEDSNNAQLLADDSQSGSGSAATSAQAARVCVFRGAPPSTREHAQIRAGIFRECRIIPVNTMYKKVCMTPGQERLFFSAPRNPRPAGNRMLYDIANQNYRHHSDVNRDLTRSEMGSVCRNYCRPSQFRYVY